MQTVEPRLEHACARYQVLRIANRLRYFGAALLMVFGALLMMPIDQASADFDHFWEEEVRPQQKRRAYTRTSRNSVYSNAKRRSKTVRRASKKGGYAKKQGKRSVRLASLGKKDDYQGYGYASPKADIGGGGAIRWVASARCLNSSLVGVINQVAANFGAVTVNSTCRSRRQNARAGGARRSKHLSGNAVDFRVRGNVSAVYAFLRSNTSVGGLKHYGRGLFHIDTGPRRRW